MRRRCLRKSQEHNYSRKPLKVVREFYTDIEINATFISHYVSAPTVENKGGTPRQVLARLSVPSASPDPRGAWFGYYGHIVWDGFSVSW
jgi:hypothetical protein